MLIFPEQNLIKIHKIKILQNQSLYLNFTRNNSFVYNIVMKFAQKMRLYSWVEFALWLLIISVAVFGVRYHHYLKQKQYKSYQIFLSDVDGLIVGSPVRFLGIQIGHVTKLQIISSNVYVKFIITQKDLTLPQGSIATVEGSGLGGSKSLEIYPPEKGVVTDKIIVTKDPTRLGRVISLFKGIFKDIDEIVSSFSYASAKIEAEKYLPPNVVIPDENNSGFAEINKNIDLIIEKEKSIKHKLKLDKNNEK